MRKILAASLLISTLSACDVAPPEESVVESAVYCNTPLFLPCYPWHRDQDWNYCNDSCRALNDTGGYCPPVTDSEYDWCQFHPNDPDFPCVNGQSRRAHRCVTQTVSLAPR